MPQQEPAEFLPWDSEFFGYRIARVKANDADAAAGRQVLEWCAAEHIDCLYFLADPASVSALSWAHDSGFQLVDIRATLHIDLPAAERTAEPTTKPAAAAASVAACKPGDLPALREIARLSHRDSRFYWDTHFRAKSDSLFETWIEKSCQDFASMVLVAEIDGAAAGYITLDYGSPDDSSIGLFAVGPEARGRGAGRQLVACGLEWLRSQGAEQCRVVTQGRNRAALRLYQKAGFRVDDLKLWYHLWLNRRPVR